MPAHPAGGHVELIRHRKNGEKQGPQLRLDKGKAVDDDTCNRNLKAICTSRKAACSCKSCGLCASPPKSIVRHAPLLLSLDWSIRAIRWPYHRVRRFRRRLKPQRNCNPMGLPAHSARTPQKDGIHRVRAEPVCTRPLDDCYAVSRKGIPNFFACSVGQHCGDLKNDEQILFNQNKFFNAIQKESI